MSLNPINFHTKITQISPLPYKCPNCFYPTSVKIVREEDCITLLYTITIINYWSENTESSLPYYLCLKCDWKGNSLKLTSEQLKILDRRRCGGCGELFENENFRYCPYCGNIRPL